MNTCALRGESTGDLSTIGRRRLRRLRSAALVAVLVVLCGAGGLPPGVWPLEGPVVRDYDAPDPDWLPGHRGVDLGTEPGAPVVAAAAGTVTHVGPIAGRGVVVVDHGSVRTTYEPVDPTVTSGTVVAAGDRIGTVTAGHPGCPVAACLHWGLREQERYRDPRDLLGGAEGQVRMVAGDSREAVEQAASNRPAPTDGGLGSPSPPGPHGFSQPVPGSITSPFGMRVHPVTGVYKLHDGTDWGAACGTPIRAPYAGTVTSVGSSGAWGNRLILDHGTVDGRSVRTSYNHASGFTVPAGSRVEAGQVIGRVGSTGYSTGCHLHLQLWLDGGIVDPMSWF
ncbi:M23 family metallopeptidase [Naumannella halotolerans]|uniref:Peptidase M23-like protein n=1 Tax=Naumannella halotolerans TaxID=993414 RepID=A0A4R7J684_9ACTN|nr:peptidoglycan DD-metalloendopeptidase family protein [Naumannella halotolerans]TDT32892.1 peptidase M23-like protein [Naumannella halotolerans]